MIKVLFVGDIIGRTGRQILKKSLKEKKGEYDLVIGNGENAAGGGGLTVEVVKELHQCGIDIITTGNHVFNKKEIFQIIEEDEFLLRPANFPEATVGRGFCVKEIKNGIKIGVINLVGRVFMNSLLDCPFRCVDRLLCKIKDITNIWIVDMHAEATSEKMAMGWFLDGKVSAVIGTHTHVQTADQRILSNNTAYITDVGMIGARDSVIGLRIDKMINKFLTQIPQRPEVAKGVGIYCGVLIEIDKDGKVKDITRFQEIMTEDAS